ncbi:MAG TPA: lipid-binding SYLF domain-containing protein [Syntrophobacteraceae bacterium]|nr:lipid-binding SYLF domain-containing protein [Syntrophobacteraceae bacterium]
MTQRSALTFFIMALSLCLLLPAPAGAGMSEDAKVQASTAVIREVMDIPESAIPPSLLHMAQGIAIFPDLLKAGFILGGRYGVGVLLVRNEDRSWGNPVFFRLIGGSIGWQIGAQSSDVILVLKSIRSLDAIYGGKFTLGADASIAAGPVGRQAEAATDIMLRAEILSYSRTRGLFAGLSFEGAAILVDYGSTASFYNSPGLLPVDVSKNPNIITPPAAAELRRVLDWYSR